MEPPSPAFLSKKSQIIRQLECPDDEYSDLSPKGSIDAPIRDEIDLINSSPVMVTTSSCSGRVAVFLEGRRGQRDQQVPSSNTDEPETDAGVIPSAATIHESKSKIGQVGGKGDGGKWLFVSHSPVDSLASSQGNSPPKWHELFKMDNQRTGLDGDAVLNSSSLPVGLTSFVHLKFEPFILHVLTSSIATAQAVLSSALQAGFRESGVVGLSPHPDGTYSPVVAVRSNGLAFESIIGYLSSATSRPTLDSDDTTAPSSSGDSIQSLVTELYLDSLINLANHRFAENTKRIGRFITELRRRPILGLGPTQDEVDDNGTVGVCESKEERRRRKKEEGLARQRLLQLAVSAGEHVSPPVDQINSSLETDCSK